MPSFNKKYILIFILSILAILLIVFVIFINSPRTEKFSSEEEIIKIKETVLNISEQDDLGNIQITHLSAKYARAESDSDIDFFLINIESEWKNVFATTEPVFCERAEKFGFPADFISDCVLEFSQAIDISEYLEDENINSTGPTEVIVNLSQNQDPFCDCLIVEDDENTVTIDYSGNLPANPGDTLVVIIDDGEIVEIVDVIEDTIDADENDDSDDEETPTIYINSDPEVAPKDDNLLFLDIDQSGKEIQLITDL